MGDYNMNFVYDNDLREVPEDPESMGEGFAALLEAAEKEEDEVKKAVIESKAAMYARVLGLHEDSENLFVDAIKILKAHEMSKQATELRTRLAVTHLMMGKEEEANKIFDQIVEKAVTNPKDENLSKLKAICLMAQGRSKFWNNQLPGAIRCFKEAAEIKLNLGDNKGYGQCNEVIQKAEAKKQEAMGGSGETSQEAADSFIDPLLDLDGTNEEE